jgi:adenylate kinase
MKHLFFLIGAPGSGKTTDASLIAEKYAHVAHYSAGEMLRAEVAKGSETGQQIDRIISKGNIVPVELINHSIESTILTEEATVILIDGFPRSIEQMEAFDALLKHHSSITLHCVIEVYVSESVAKERVLGRATESKEVRSDDNEEVFQNRMKLYLEPLESIQNFYQKRNLHHIVNGERNIEEVVSEMERFILEKV